MTLTLRPAQPAELPALVALINRAFRGTGPHAGWNTEAVFIEGDRTTLPLLQAELAAKPDAILLAAQADAQSPIHGCVLLQPLARGTWYLGSLTVDPTLQNAGLGRSLLAAAEAWARERGATGIQMTVVNVRDTLIAWYQRRGYRLTGETRPFPYGDTRFGIPRRDNLGFVVLEKSFSAAAG
jgi:ribosomal protein S18 acetylase RimI-like enzyme